MSSLYLRTILLLRGRWADLPLAHRCLVFLNLKFRRRILASRFSLVKGPGGIMVDRTKCTLDVPGAAP